MIKGLFKTTFILSLTLLICIVLSMTQQTVLAENENEYFLARIDEKKIDILKNNDYELEKVGLKSMPDLYKVKRKKTSTFGLVIEPFLIKEKKERKQYKVSTNDIYFDNQWNIPKIKADEAWTAGATGSSDVTVAVLDTGLNIGRDPVKNPVHEDLVGRLWQNTGEITGNGIDDDGNGKIDDTDGWNFVENNNNPSPVDGGSIDGDYKHGTLVAGVIAATAGNSVGVAGIDHNAKIMPIRVMDNNGDGWTTDIALAIEYAADNGAKVINMSLGYAHSYGSDPILEAAINHVHGLGVVIVAASGNDGLGVNYPAASPNVIAVGATDQNDNITIFSSYGPELDVVAPGVSIPTTGINWTGTAYTSDTYWSVGGTSLSAPHVAALASLLFEDGLLTNSQVEAKIVTWADKVSGMSGQIKTDHYGHGRINNTRTIFEPNLLGSYDQGGVYYIDGTTKRPISTVSTFTNWGFDWNNVYWAPLSVIESYTMGQSLTQLASNSGGVYLVQNNTFRPIFDSSTLNIFKDNWGVGWNDITPISDTLFASKSQGPLITFPRLVTYSNGGTVYYLDTDGMRPIQSASTFEHWGFNWNEIFYTRNNSFLASYPSPSPLSVLASNNGGVYIISNGTKRPINSAQSFNNHASFDPVFRWDNIFPVSDQALSALTLGDMVY